MTVESQIPSGFDFEAHRRAAVDQYQKRGPLYESFAEVVKAILGEALRNRRIKVASIEARAKTLESFAPIHWRPILVNQNTEIPWRR